MSETYCILFNDPQKGGNIFYAEYAIDWNWLLKGRWAVSEKEIGSVWYLAEGGLLDDRAYRALLKHFGLDYCEIPLKKIIFMSPAELAAHRREKEKRYGLEKKEMINQKMGDHQPAEVFN